MSEHERRKLSLKRGENDNTAAPRLEERLHHAEAGGQLGGGELPRVEADANHKVGARDGEHQHAHVQREDAPAEPVRGVNLQERGAHHPNVAAAHVRQHQGEQGERKIGRAAKDDIGGAEQEKANADAPPHAALAFADDPVAHQGADAGAQSPRGVEKTDSKRAVARDRKDVLAENYQEKQAAAQTADAKFRHDQRHHSWILLQVARALEDYVGLRIWRRVVCRALRRGHMSFLAANSL